MSNGKPGRPPRDADDRLIRTIFRLPASLLDRIDEARMRNRRHTGRRASCSEFIRASIIAVFAADIDFTHCHSEEQVIAAIRARIAPAAAPEPTVKGKKPSGKAEAA